MRDIYNVTENTITERREVELQQTIAEQKQFIQQQQETIDHKEGTIRDLNIAFQDGSYMLNIINKGEGDMHGDDLDDLRCFKSQLDNICKPLHDKIAELEKQLNIASEYKRLYEDLQNSLDAPSAAPLDCPRVETHSALWNPDDCDIAEWKQIVKPLSRPECERIIEYFQRTWGSVFYGDGVCPCKHPILVRIVKKKVVKDPQDGRTAEYTVILQQRRTGKQAEVKLLERYFDFELLKNCQNSMTGKPVTFNWAPEYTEALKKFNQ